MTIGVGGSDAQTELQLLNNMASGSQSITHNEHQSRIDKATQLMRENKLAAIYLDAGTNLYYFTGTRWRGSECMVGALLTASGELHYIAPAFEIGTIQGFMKIEGRVHGWQEHESPYQLFSTMLERLGISNSTIGLDEGVAYFISNGLVQSCKETQFVDAKKITAACRSRKSDTEIDLMQRAKNMTLEVHKSAAKILKEGMTTSELNSFIHQAHMTVGAPAGSTFCISLFGEDSAYPHGVSNPKPLSKGDMVLIDTGCHVEGYNSDITRSYVFGQATERDREVWDQEKAAQAKAFKAAQLGAPCGSVDIAARTYLEQQGYGPAYATPGLPHRTGHGIGLDIHEWPYLVASDTTPLDVGMCFSNEPMICIPGEFGIRLEDHFYMTSAGAKWFTQPSHSVDDPFGLEV